jgi:pSer/pThr/pTyr-binding forkhead associated (FHA) protein
MTYQLILQWTENNQLKSSTIDSQSPTKIGRDHTSTDCNLVINPQDLSISRVHIAIFFDRQNNTFLLENLKGSQNPIQVDGKYIDNGYIALTKDTSIMLGNTLIKVIDIVVPETIISFRNVPQICVKYYQNNSLQEKILQLPIALGKSLIVMDQRKQNNNITPVEINHHHVSSYHSLMDWENGQLVIMDQNSTNGTYVNNIKQNPLSKIPLNHGDELKLGTVEGKVNINTSLITITINNDEASRNTTVVSSPPFTPLIIQEIKVKLYDMSGEKKDISVKPPIALGRDLPSLKQKINQQQITLIEINEVSISGYHCLIEWENGQLFITDQNSSNGTFINNNRQNPYMRVMLKDGDNLKLGTVEGKFIRNMSEITIDLNNVPNPSPSSEYGLYCPQCQKTYLNKTRDDLFCDQGHFFTGAISVYVPKNN